MEINSDKDFLSMAANDPFVAGTDFRFHSISSIPVDVDRVEGIFYGLNYLTINYI